MYRLLSAQDIKKMSKATFSGTEHDYLLEEIIIPQVGPLLAGECNRPDFDKKARIELFSPRENQSVLFLKSPPIAVPVSLRTTALEWIASGTGTNTFYVRLVGGGNPQLDDPIVLYANGVAMTRGPIATLASSQFAYGDQDTLGYRTIYVRLSDGTDPDSKDAGYLEANPVQVWQSSANPRVFDATTILIKDTDYSLDHELGTVTREGCAGFLKGMQTVKVSYVGADGYLTADAQNVPPLLRGVAIDQALTMFERRGELGVTSRSNESGSMNLAPLILPLDIKRKLKPFTLPKSF